MTTIHELIQTQAEQTPDAIAITFEASSLTYRALDRRADDLARQLRMGGFGPECRAALFFERSFDMIVAMLAVLKAGGAYIPLDPAHPPQRLGFMLADARPAVLLTHRRLGAELPPHRDLDVIMIDEAPRAGTRHPDFESSRNCNANDIAYLIYTSGSTGHPKGVEIRHRSVVTMLKSMRHRPGIDAGDVMLANTTLVFDIAVLEIFLPLTVGARILLAPGRIARDGMALGGLIESGGATILQATPSTLAMLLDVEWRGAPNLKILCGGETWTQALASRLLPRCGSLWNMYGPTETTVWSAVSQVTAANPVVIGHPIAGTVFYVLGPDAEPLAAGIPGELYIGGEGLARGYFNAPERTRERFVPDPFSNRPGARMYRTGDQVSRLPDGMLKFLGRLDHQVKIRGFRIELEEIEAALRNYPGVRQTVVIGHQDQPDQLRLVAYLVGETEFPPAALRAHLAATLPAYMIPTAYRRLDALPLTPNGKLDRSALPPPGSWGNEAGSAEVEPATPAPKALAKIWCDMLALAEVGIHDNFFDLGGHSLLAVRAIARINKTLKCALTIPVFYRDPTINGLAQAIARDCGAPRCAQLLPLQTGRIGLPLYLIGAGPQEVRLARHIGGDRAIFAVESPIPTGWYRNNATPEPAPTIEELGKRYGDVLYGHAGDAPCVIAGYSFAGKIAFEAARILRRAGGEVAYILLIDAPAYPGERHAGVDFKRSFRWIWHGAHRRRGNAASRLDTLGSMLGNYLRLFLWLGARLPGIVGNQIDKAMNGFAPVFNLSGYLDQNGIPIDQALMDELDDRAGGEWQPTPLDAAGVLFRVEFPGSDALPGHDSSLGWGGLFARGLRTVQAAGDHISMMQGEHIVTLARQIGAVLDQTEIESRHETIRRDHEADAGLGPERTGNVFQLPSLS